MEAIVMHIIDKESKELNLTFTITERGKGRKQVNWRYEGEILDSKRFMDSYQHMKHKLRNLANYDGWDITCQRMPDGSVKVLNEGSLFFNGDDKSSEEYALILDLESQ